MAAESRPTCARACWCSRYECCHNSVAPLPASSAAAPLPACALHVGCLWPTSSDSISSLVLSEIMVACTFVRPLATKLVAAMEMAVSKLKSITVKNWVEAETALADLLRAAAGGTRTLRNCYSELVMLHLRMCRARAMSAI